MNRFSSPVLLFRIYTSVLLSSWELSCVIISKSARSLDGGFSADVGGSDVGVSEGTSVGSTDVDVGD